MTETLLLECERCRWCGAEYVKRTCQCDGAREALRLWNEDLARHSRKVMMKVEAKDLKPGMLIDPPAGEWQWVSSFLTVIRVEPGPTDTRGSWVNVIASFKKRLGPYSKVYEDAFLYRPNKQIQVLERGQPRSQHHG